MDPTSSQSYNPQGAPWKSAESTVHLENDGSPNPPQSYNLTWH